MLDIKFIRENIDLVKKNCVNRKVKVDIDKLLTLDESRRDNLSKIETLRAERNQKSKGKPSDTEIAKLKQVGGEIKNLEIILSQVEAEYFELLKAVPNMTHPESPVGGEEYYKVVFTGGKPKNFAFKPKDHEELMLSNDLIDFDRGTKVAASKFYFTKGNLVRMNQALINYGIDVVAKHGYEVVETPDMAKDEILQGIGFNPRGPETQVYSIENTDLSLIGTAEITMGGYHAGEVLDLSKGPKKYVALSHCFRTEAGAYGKVSKGLYRVHQFAKLEMFIFCKPEESEKYHQEILDIEKEILKGLDLPYRVIDIPTGDLGGPAYRKFDIEAWMTMKGEGESQGGYSEVTSCSNCTDYQARRLNIKYRKEDGSTEFVHTLNGTAVVLSRFPLSIVENYQQKDGSIAVPKALKKYCGLKKL
ncbi:MAG: serine--tRNA ligase [Candidatus Magasanikbacteria bacterium]|nr:serine--tRNA ligase [Candidatus Magasanikbacteria bacterium]